MNENLKKYNPWELLHWKLSCMVVVILFCHCVRYLKAQQIAPEQNSMQIHYIFWVPKLLTCVCCCDEFYNTKSNTVSWLFKSSGWDFAFWYDFWFGVSLSPVFFHCRDNFFKSMLSINAKLTSLLWHKRLCS